MRSGSPRAAAKLGSDPEELVDTYIWSLNQIATTRPAGMSIAAASLQGQLQGPLAGARRLRRGRRKLFNEAQVDTFFLEYDSARAGGFEPLRQVPKSKNVMLGLISSKTPAPEPLDALKRRVEDAGRYISLDQVGVSPQCGFASSVGGNPLTIDDERRKLARVVELADAVWG